MNAFFDPLHISTGLAIFFTAVVLTRGFASTAIPILCVIVFEVIVLWGPAVQGSAVSHDAILKLLGATAWPFVIVILGRLGLLNLLTEHSIRGSKNKR